MKEEQIRPQKVFDEYLMLAELDAKKYFIDSTRQSIFCPACESNGEHSFDKHGFSYEECLNCQTIFVNPRPPLEDFIRYYIHNTSCHAWPSNMMGDRAEVAQNSPSFQ